MKNYRSSEKAEVEKSLLFVATESATKLPARARHQFGSAKLIEGYYIEWDIPFYIQTMERGIEMEYTLSWHNEGSMARQAHNRRDSNAIGNRDIDRTKTDQNIIIIDTPIKQAYQNIFNSAVSEYNGRVRASRQIKDYYTTVSKDAKKHTAYEVIVQIGCVKEGSPDMAVQALLKYATTWDNRNPNLILTGAYIHMDESVPHLHLDYIPIARCNRGMHLQNSLTRALKAQGFISNSAKDTAQIQWQDSERSAMRAICEEMHISLQEQGIGRKRHLGVAEYKELQDNIEKRNKDLEMLINKCSEYEALKNEYQNEGYEYLQECIDFRQVVQQEYPDYASDVLNHLHNLSSNEELQYDEIGQ